MDKDFKQKLHLLMRFTTDFIKLHTGKGPNSTKIHLLSNKILIEMSDYLTPIEKVLASTADGRNNIRDSRNILSSNLAGGYFRKATAILGISVLRGAIAWNIKYDEAFLILILQESIQTSDQYF